MSTFSNTFKTIFNTLLSVSPFDNTISDVRNHAVEMTIYKIINSYIPDNLLQTIKVSVRFDKMNPEVWEQIDGATSEIEGYSVKDDILAHLSLSYLKSNTVSIHDLYLSYINHAIKEIICMHVPDAIAGYVNFEVHPDTLMEWSKYIHRSK